LKPARHAIQRREPGRHTRHDALVLLRVFDLAVEFSRPIFDQHKPSTGCRAADRHHASLGFIENRGRIIRRVVRLTQHPRRRGNQLP
jgi:hypothetical protein